MIIKRDLNLELLDQNELVYIEGGQCDCSNSGASAAKALKKWWKEAKKAFGEALSSGSYASTMML